MGIRRVSLRRLIHSVKSLGSRCSSIVSSDVISRKRTKAEGRLVPTTELKPKKRTRMLDTIRRKHVRRSAASRGTKIDADAEGIVVAKESQSRASLVNGPQRRSFASSRKSQSDDHQRRSFESSRKSTDDHQRRSFASSRKSQSDDSHRRSFVLARKTQSLSSLSDSKRELNTPQERPSDRIQFKKSLSVPESLPRTSALLVPGASEAIIEANSSNLLSLTDAVLLPIDVICGQRASFDAVPLEGKAASIVHSSIQDSPGMSEHKTCLVNFPPVDCQEPERMGSRPAFKLDRVQAVTRRLWRQDSRRYQETRARQPRRGVLSLALDDEFKDYLKQYTIYEHEDSQESDTQRRSGSVRKSDHTHSSSRNTTRFGSLPSAWQWRAGSIWKNWDGKNSEHLESGWDQYQRGGSSHLMLTYGKYRYSINFKLMMQMNTKTNRKREIRRAQI